MASEQIRENVVGIIKSLAQVGVIEPSTIDGVEDKVLSEVVEQLAGYTHELGNYFLQAPVGEKSRDQLESEMSNLLIQLAESEDVLPSPTEDISDEIFALSTITVEMISKIQIFVAGLRVRE